MTKIDPQQDLNLRHDLIPNSQKNSELRSRPCNYDPEKILVSKEDFLELRKISLRTQYNTVRFLLSKVEREGSLSERENFILLHCFENCDSKGDYFWIISRRFKLDKFKKLIEDYLRILYLKVPVKETFANITKGITYRKFLHTPHAYYGLRKFFNVKNFVRRKNLRIQKAPPPKRFLGVGYKDQGSRRIPEEDGTQTWQEVASCESYQSKNVPRQWSEPDKEKLSNFGRHPERLSWIE